MSTSTRVNGPDQTTAELIELGRRVESHPEWSGAWDREAAAVGAMMSAEGLTTLVEVGCWLGPVLSRVLKTGAARRGVGLDAVPGVVGAARALVPDDRAEFVNAEVVPMRLGTSPPAVRLDANDSARSAIDATGVSVTGVPVITVGQLGALVGSEPTTWLLRFDLGTLDAELVLDALSCGIRPGAIEFGGHVDGEQVEAVQRELRRLGYQVPQWSWHRDGASLIAGRKACRVVNGTTSGRA